MAETMTGTFELRPDGRWVPAIPEPYPLLLRVRCSCGAKFWSRDAYRLHYGAEHQEASHVGH